MVLRAISFKPYILLVQCGRGSSQHWQGSSQHWQGSSQHWQGSSQHWQDHLNIGRTISTLAGIISTLAGIISTLAGIISTLVGIISTLAGIISTLAGPSEYQCNWSCGPPRIIFLFCYPWYPIPIGPSHSMAYLVPRYFLLRVWNNNPIIVDFIVFWSVKHLCQHLTTIVNKWYWISVAIKFQWDKIFGTLGIIHCGHKGGRIFFYVSHLHGAMKQGRSVEIK